MCNFRQADSRLFLCGVLLLALMATANPTLAQTNHTCESTGIVGPLRVSLANPRYFANDCGRSIYMTGTHTWNNFPDMDNTDPYDSEPFNYDAYLDFLDLNNHNFIRLWAWEGFYPDNADRYPRRVWSGPHPWQRTGPGTDMKGKPKFDLTQWNSDYFSRLVSRVQLAQDRGIYVSIMLFEGWELGNAPVKRFILSTPATTSMAFTMVRRPTTFTR